MITMWIALLASFVGQAHPWIIPQCYQRPLKVSVPYSPRYPHHSLISSPNPKLTASRTISLQSTNSIELESILSNLDDAKLPILHIAKRIGSGSYGTVHKCHLIRSQDDVATCVAKRVWSYEEIQANVPTKVADSDKVVARTGLAYAKKETNNVQISNEETKKRFQRCQHYWKVERHCFEKLERLKRDGGEKLLSKALPSFLGVFDDDGSGTLAEDMVDGYGLQGQNKQTDLFNDDDNTLNGHQWMVFESIQSIKGKDDTATLLDAMEIDWNDRYTSKGNTNHLSGVKKAMGLPDSYEFGETLDKVFESLLENMKVLHEAKIVHRDLKPGNLLCDPQNQRLRLIDLGSAADLDPSQTNLSASNILSGGKVRIGLDEGIVALSPVYAAPETFIKVEDNPTHFDVFSAALIICQLLFNLLDERTDAAFYQQLKDVEYNLDSWLENQLKAKLRPAGLDDALEYLGERRGLWRVLKNMLQPNPLQRISSKDALLQFNEVMGLKTGDIEWTDPIIIKVAKEEAYFETVVDSFERCEINYDMFNGDDAREMPRPLYFLASFKSNKPIGLILSEAPEANEKNDGMSEENWIRWKSATKNSFPGEVFVKGWANGGQADCLGIFEVGDRLRGVGELPFVDGGFEGAIKLIEKQPKTGGTIRLHFDRQRTEQKKPASSLKGSLNCMKVTGQGTWKSKGRRNTQEDNFLLHEIKNSNVGDVLLCGVLDGHGGTAASDSVSKILPPLFSEELELSDVKGHQAIAEALEKSWDLTCTTYRSLCENGECVVDYDPMEGILYAETGSLDLIAGTTATLAAISLNPSGASEMTVLNCGDSRTLVVGECKDDSHTSVIAFETRDHSPDDELEIQRLQRGKDEGLDYSVPECAMGQSYLRVGDFQYALCRSLEGTYVTSKGVVSDPDVTTLQLSQMLDNRQYCAVVLACDGLFEVMSNEEVGREVIRMRKEGYKAGEISKNLCGQALKKGSYDNISTIIVFLDNA